MQHVRIHIAAFVAIVVATASAWAQVFVPNGKEPGDMYHLVFVTYGTRDATSTDMTDYNAFVQAEAERAGAITENWGIQWFAMASTATVDARDNALVEAPVYLLNRGTTTIADGFEDMWDGSQNTHLGIYQSQFDGAHPAPIARDDTSAVWTGSTSDGTGRPGFVLGDLNVGVGAFTNYDFLCPILCFDVPSSSNAYMFALSEKLIVPAHVQPGDSDMNYVFDQLDLVKAQQAAKYLTGQPATWGEGDWDGGPGGYPGAPPIGNSLFNQNDIVAALQAGTYLAGPYAALVGPGVLGDEQTSLVYDALTGELSVDAPASKELTSINISSAICMFTGEKPKVLSGAFDNFNTGFPNVGGSACNRLNRLVNRVDAPVEKQVHRFERSPIHLVLSVPRHRVESDQEGNRADAVHSAPPRQVKSSWPRNSVE